MSTCKDHWYVLPLNTNDKPFIIEGDREEAVRIQKILKRAGIVCTLLHETNSLTGMVFTDDGELQEK